MNTNNYIEYHKKMLNKQVLVVSKDTEDWIGFIKKIKNDSYFVVERASDNKLIEVNMFDIRSL
jgi:hypothetical protein|tara:strand:- start:3862 stop:4050 length:189 start_codon:yes stop_codon:yes gene_type:complete